MTFRNDGNITASATLCGSNETVSKGVRRNKTVGDRKVRRCKSCRRKFTPKNQQPLKAEEDEN